MNTEIVGEILKEIQKANSVLLHCHPSPDPDSMGSALAMKFVLEQLGKKVTVIQGDSVIPKSFMHFPGAESIILKSFSEIDLKEFDLFISLDSASPDMITRVNTPVFPLVIPTIGIDHHRTNSGYCSINLVDTSYPATALILADLFKQWGITMNSNIASNLFIGAYTDTGGFKYEGVKPSTFHTAGDLASYIDDLPQLISKMENSTTLGFLKFQAAALEAITIHFGGILALSALPYQTIKSKEIADEDIQASRISSFLRTVPDWKIVGCAVEYPEGEVKISFRSSDSKTYDVSKLSLALGGGGHKAAAGVRMVMPYDEALKKVVETVKIIYNL